MKRLLFLCILLLFTSCIPDFQNSNSESTLNENELPFSTITSIEFISPTTSPTITPSFGSTQVSTIDGMVMLFVPSGEFLMGAETRQGYDACMENCDTDYCGCEERWFEAEGPPHEVFVSAFWIDQTEITNLMYAKCIKAGSCELPEYTAEGNVPQNTDYFEDAANADHPIVEVDWFEAQSYCEWAGRRLPTEAEWEKAARGTDALEFPWGNEFDSMLANYCDVNCPVEYAEEYLSEFNDGYSYTSPVGSYPDGKSPYGAFDMAGNVWEWIADWYDEEYYSVSPNENPTGPSSGESKVLRGGNFHHIWWTMRLLLALAGSRISKRIILGFDVHSLSEYLGLEEVERWILKLKTHKYLNRNILMAKLRFTQKCIIFSEYLEVS
jgi:formylglycine-generating enzyme required for sulfatase activity